MQIGDLYFAFRGNGARLQADAKVEGAKAGTTLGKSMTAGIRKSFSGEQLGQGLVSGLGLAGALGAFSLASKAASAFVDILGDATRAAIEDQASQQKLTTSLRDNVDGWDGNTDAIERTLKERMKLGFSDDEQRDSLAKLTGATHDVTKALDQQRLAMDLARYAGITLGDASDALIKINTGQFRALKGLGINLSKAADATEALAEVQKLVNGQAEDYSKTIAGEMVIVQAQVNEKLEELGYKLLPVVAKGLGAVADALDYFTPAGDSFEDFMAAVEKGDQHAKLLFGDLQWSAKQAGVSVAEAYDVMTTTGVEAGKNLVGAIRAQQAAQRDLVESNRIAGVSVDTLATKTDDLATTAVDKTRIVENAFSTLAASLSDSAQAAIDGFFGPIEAEQDRYNARIELQAAEEELRTAKTAQDKEAAKQRIVAALKAEGEAVTKLGEQGGLTGSKLDTFTNDAAGAFKTMGEKIPPDIKKITDPLHTLVGYDGKTIDLSVLLKTYARVVGGSVQDFGSLSKGPAHAAGGYQRAGEPFTMNEHGIEAIVPWDAYVMGHNRTVQAMQGATIPSVAGAGGINQTNHFNIAATSPARKPSDIIREARIRARDGSLNPWARVR